MLEQPKGPLNSTGRSASSNATTSGAMAICAFGCLALLGLVGPGFAQSRSGPSDLSAEQLKYEEELAAALQPVQKRYVTRLQAMQKLMARKGDKAGAAAVEAELEKVGAAIAQQMRYPIEGKWLVRYQSGATRTYVIHADGSVEFVEENQTGKFTKNGANVLVDFGDNKVERFYWNTVLVVEHYNPKASYGTAPPNLTGFAEKVP
jgi:hypothetical protein